MAQRMTCYGIQTPKKPTQSQKQKQIFLPTGTLMKLTQAEWEQLFDVSDEDESDFEDLNLLFQVLLYIFAFS